MSNTKFHQNLINLSNSLYLSEKLPARYVFVLTEKCNLNCPFCFQDKSSKFVLDLDIWKNLVDQIPSYGRITLTGGEPLLYKDFEKLFKYITKKHNCNLITNGLLLNEKNLSYLLSNENFKVLSISIDSITNDVRKMTPKQWNQLVENIKLFHKIKSDLKSDTILDIKCTILNENTNNLYKIYEYVFDKLNCNTFAFQFLKGSASQHATNPISFELLDRNNTFSYHDWGEIKKNLLLVRESAKLKKRKVFIHPSLIEFLSDDDINHLDIIQEPFNKSNLKPCIFPWSSVHVNFDGNIYPCISYKWGNIKDMSLKDLIQSNEAKKFKSLIETEGLVPACKNCGWLKGNFK